MNVRPATGGEKAILSPQSIRKHCISVAEIPKNNVFAPKNLIYGILVGNVAKISAYAL